MPKEVLLYDDIYSWSASKAVSELDLVKNSPEVAVRFNGDGGELRYGWAVIGKAKEIKGKKIFKNDGEANSMYAFAFFYNDNNEALDTSSFKLHRASYGLDYEKSEYFTDADKSELAEKNGKLRAAMEAKINVAAFTRITDCTIDQFFSMDDRVECLLNAEEALECGMINRVVPITPGYAEQVRALTAHMAPHRIAAHTEPITTTMTAEEIKSKHSEAYKAIFAKGKNKGVETERDRVGSILAYLDGDKKGAIEAIKKGEPLSETQRSEFAIKMASANSATSIESENPPAIVTAAEEAMPDPTKKTVTAKTEAEKKAKAEFDKAMDNEFKTRYPNSKKVA